MGATLISTNPTLMGVTHQAHTIELPSDPFRYVDAIDTTTGAMPGQLLILTAVGSGTGEIRIRDMVTTTPHTNNTTGKNIKCGGATTSMIQLNGPNDNAIFVYSGTVWIAISSFEGGS